MIFVDGVAGGRFWSFFNFIQNVHHGQLPGAKVQDAIGEVGSAVASGWDAKGRMAISMDSDGLKGARHGRSNGDRWK